MRMWRAILAAAALALAAPAWAQDIAPRAAVEHLQAGGQGIALKVLSSRNDMVSGGDALVQATLAAPATGPVQFLVNGEAVPAFVAKPAGDGRSVQALVGGLALGDNVLEARDLGRPGSAPARLVVTNHPLAGPVFAGPKEQPFVCMTQLFKLPVTGGDLGPPLDSDCSIATRVDYVYRSTAGVFKALPDARARPADLASATTRNGVSVPYIVRVETGTVDRGVYQLAVLHDPAVEPEVEHFAPPRAWNGALVYQFGGGCPGGYHVQGQNTGGVLDDYILSRGYAEASSSLNVYGNNCDDLLSAEVMMMTRERVIERLGAPAFTIGWGCSGGSYQAEQISDNYPGLLDGIVVGCSFPDVGHAAVSVHSFGARILHHYFEAAGPAWSDAQKTAVSGLPDARALEVQATRPDRTSPDNCNAVIAPAQRWGAANPGGLRCDIYEHGAVGFGRDPVSGRARRPFDNVGVQYGLEALNAALITKAQFLDLNARVGGVDGDGRFSATRNVADAVALDRAYRTGRFLSGGGGLKVQPIIDYRAYVDFDDGDPHMTFHSFSLRERLIKANGSADNLVMLHESMRYGLFSLDSPVLRSALDAMDAWIVTIKRVGAVTPAQVAAAKPPGLVEGCFTPQGEKIVERQVYRGDTACNRLYPPHANPYIAAGQGVANDIAKCALKPVDMRDYRVAFSSAEQAQLREIFPEGVCDWTRPGIGQQPLAATWLSFNPS